MGPKVVGAGVGVNTGTAVGNVMIGSTRTRLGYVVASCTCTALVAVDSWVATVLGLALFIVRVYETATPEASNERRLNEEEDAT